MTTRNFDDNYLDSILSDLEKVTDRIPSNRSSNAMNSSYTTTTVEHSPSRKATTTVSKYEYSKSNLGNEPIYQNDRNVNELSSFLNEFDQSRETYNRYGQTNGYSTYTKHSNEASSSQQVNQLISNLERNLANPEEALKWKGQQVRPVTMTEYYEESKKVSNLGNKQTANVGRTYSSNERIRSVSPAGTRGKGLSDVQQIRAASPHTEAVMTTTTYETKINKQYPVTKSSQQQQYQQTQQQQQTSSATTNNQQQYQTQKTQTASSSSNQNLSQEKRSTQSSFNQQQSRQASRASNATHELDDLMATLDDFNVNDNQRQSKTNTQFKTTKNVIKGAYNQVDGPDYASVTKSRNQYQDDSSLHQRSTSSSRTRQAGVTETRSTTATKEIKNLGDLENIIGSIEIEMNKQGLETLAKGSCYSCRKNIIGQVITALGRQYHPSCFVCEHCKQELGERTFFERDGQCYCEYDYHNLFAPKCAYEACGQPITGRQKCVSALNTTYHAEHFVCHECQTQFTEDKGYHEHNNRAYCADCYLNIFAPKCTDCDKPITAAFISALGGQWHTSCFVCTECRCEFAAGAFFEYEGRPYCETHFHAKKGTLCAGCHKPITGRCVTAMFRKFHPEHFVCSYCLKQLNKGTFKEQNDKPYCHSCFERVFS